MFKLFLQSCNDDTACEKICKNEGSSYDLCFDCFIEDKDYSKAYTLAIHNGNDTVVINHFENKLLPSNYKIDSSNINVLYTYVRCKTQQNQFDFSEKYLYSINKYYKNSIVLDLVFNYFYRKKDISKLPQYYALYYDEPYKEMGYLYAARYCKKIKKEYIASQFYSQYSQLNIMDKESVYYLYEVNKKNNNTVELISFLEKNQNFFKNPYYYDILYKSYLDVNRIDLAEDLKNKITLGTHEYKYLK